MGLQLCVHVSMCVYKGVNLGGVGGGELGAGGVGINSSPFIESNRRPNRPCAFFSISHSLQ